MLRLEHKDVIRIMRKLGYPCDKKGVCRGVTMMGIHACSVNEVEVFNERLAFIDAHLDVDLVSIIKAVKKKLAKESASSNLPKKWVPSDEEQTIIDLLAFFDGIMLYQDPGKTPAYFDTPCSWIDVEIISKVTQSQRLEQSGGLKEVMSWSGIYNDKELASYFAFLDRMAKNSDQSFSIALTSYDHAIAIHYDANIKEWYVLDANELPIQRLSTASRFHTLVNRVLKCSSGMTASSSLPAWVKQAFMESGKMTVFSSTIYLPGNKAAVADKLRNDISNSDVFKSLHAIKNHKINEFHGRGAELAHVAAIHGHAAVIETLHRAGVDLNQANKNDETPAVIAAYNNSCLVLLALENAGVDLMKSTSFGTPLYVARRKGHTECIQFLEDYIKRKSHQQSMLFFASRHDFRLRSAVAAAESESCCFDVSP